MYFTVQKWFGVYWGETPRSSSNLQKVPINKHFPRLLKFTPNPIFTKFWICPHNQWLFSPHTHTYINGSYTVKLTDLHQVTFKPAPSHVRLNSFTGLLSNWRLLNRKAFLGNLCTLPTLGGAFRHHLQHSVCMKEANNTYYRRWKGHTATKSEVGANFFPYSETSEQCHALRICTQYLHIL